MAAPLKRLRYSRETRPLISEQSKEKYYESSKIEKQIGKHLWYYKLGKTIRYTVFQKHNTSITSLLWKTLNLSEKLANCTFPTKPWKSILKLCTLKKTRHSKELSRNNLIEFSFRGVTETELQKIIRERLNDKRVNGDIPLNILNGSKFFFDVITHCKN